MPPPQSSSNPQAQEPRPNQCSRPDQEPLPEDRILYAAGPTTTDRHQEPLPENRNRYACRNLIETALTAGRKEDVM